MKFKKEYGIAVLVAVIVLIGTFLLQDNISSNRMPTDGNTANDISVEECADQPVDIPVAEEITPESTGTEPVPAENPATDTGTASAVGQQPAGVSSGTGGSTAEKPSSGAGGSTAANPSAGSSNTQEKPSAGTNNYQKDPVVKCDLKISCATILNNMDKLAEGKESLIPADGILLDLKDVEFKKGDTVFDLLQRELKARNLHIEYEKNAVYNSIYVEGICNIYEFDCGELSGWEYSVNGKFAGVASSEYKLSDGDVINWLYTCDLGRDIGNEYHGK